MKNQKPMSRSRSALIHKIERQLKQASDLQVAYERAKKLNPGFRIPFMEDQSAVGNVTSANSQ